MIQLIIGASLIFCGGLLLGGALASGKVNDLYSKIEFLKENYKDRKYLYVVEREREGYWADFKRGTVLKLIRDCRDNEGYFEDKTGRKGYLDFSNLKKMSNYIKKL